MDARYACASVSTSSSQNRCITLLAFSIACLATSAISSSPFVKSSIHATSVLISSGSLVITPWILVLTDGSISAISRTKIPTRNRSAPQIATLRAAFQAL